MRITYRIENGISSTKCNVRGLFFLPHPDYHTHRAPPLISFLGQPAVVGVSLSAAAAPHTGAAVPSDFHDQWLPFSGVLSFHIRHFASNSSGATAAPSQFNINLLF